MERPEDLLEALRPWLRVLRATTEIEGLSRDASKPIDVHVRMDEPVDCRTFEGLELLALLSEVDYGAWKSAMWATWTEEAARLVDISTGRALRLGCAFHFDSDVVDLDAHIDRVLNRVINGRCQSTDSTGYAELRSRLEAAYRYREEDASSFKLNPVPRDELEVSVWVRLDHSTYLSQLKTVRRLVEAQRTARNASLALNHREWKPLFRVRRTTQLYSSVPLDSNETIQLMAQIVEAGGFVDRLRVHRLDTSARGMKALTNNLQIVLGCPSSTLPQEKGAVDAVVISRLLDHRERNVMYAALATSQTVTRVFLNSESEIDGGPRPVGPQGPSPPVALDRVRAVQSACLKPYRRRSPLC